VDYDCGSPSASAFDYEDVSDAAFAEFFVWGSRESDFAEKLVCYALQTVGIHFF
jgi:hypothetical protein